jgi:hypothetical protein
MHTFRMLTLRKSIYISYSMNTLNGTNFLHLGIILGLKMKHKILQLKLNFKPCRLDSFKGHNQ